jgi:hypothetical protein
MDGDVQRDAEGQRRLADTGAGTDDVELASPQAAEQSIEVDESCPNSAPFSGRPASQFIEGLVEGLGQ